MTPILAVDDLYVDIPVPTGTLHAVRGIGFEVSQGETLCIVGESGCGKSLTCLAAMRLLPSVAQQRASRLEFDGQPLMQLSEREMSDVRGNQISMIFQDPMTTLNPAYTIGNQMEETLLRHQRMSRRQARERSVAMLERVGIAAAASRLKQYPHQLSGGLRQRVMIAMALLCEPSLLIADEPTTALDVTIQAQILSLIRDIQRELNIGVILITHDLGVVARVADRVAVMYAGEIIETGPAVEVFGRPRHPYTRGLLDCIPIPGKTMPGEPLGSIPGIVPSLVGDIQGCSFLERCSSATERCAETVDWRQLGDAHYYQCNVETGDGGEP
ncbi:MAG: ABC transporter ATP-binding protein [Rhodospirillales bacterium]|nr:ABC transporter ATP-binding protein [Rhodospirillales bacterium]